MSSPMNGLFMSYVGWGEYGSDLCCDLLRTNVGDTTVTEQDQAPKNGVTNS
jgi:hypothetical protein